MDGSCRPGCEYCDPLVDLPTTRDDATERFEGTMYGLFPPEWERGETPLATFRLRRHAEAYLGLLGLAGHYVAEVRVSGSWRNGE